MWLSIKVQPESLFVDINLEALCAAPPEALAHSRAKCHRASQLRPHPSESRAAQRRRRCARLPGPDVNDTEHTQRGFLKPYPPLCWFGVVHTRRPGPAPRPVASSLQQPPPRFAPAPRPSRACPLCVTHGRRGGRHACVGRGFRRGVEGGMSVLGVGFAAGR